MSVGCANIFTCNFAVRIMLVDILQQKCGLCYVRIFQKQNLTHKYLIHRTKYLNYGNFLIFFLLISVNSCILL